MNKETFGQLFKVGDELNSGGPPERANAAQLKILGIEEDGLHYKSIGSKSAKALKYQKLETVVAGYNRIDPHSIGPSIQLIYEEAGFNENISTENYEYGLAREYLRRQERLAAFRLQKSINVEKSVTERSA